MTYHYTSPLENMHSAVLVSLMLQPSLNFLAHQGPDVFKRVRQFASGAILCTDPASHQVHLDRWESQQAKWAKTVASLQNTVEKCLETTQEEVSVALAMMLKCADVGHMAQQFGNHERWVNVLTEEFYQQGDRERNLGMDPMPFMNRENKQCVPTSQVHSLPINCTM